MMEAVLDPIVYCPECDGTGRVHKGTAGGAVSRNAECPLCKGQRKILASQLRNG